MYVVPPYYFIRSSSRPESTRIPLPTKSCDIRQNVTTEIKTKKHTLTIMFSYLVNKIYVPSTPIVAFCNMISLLAYFEYNITRRYFICIELHSAD